MFNSVFGSGQITAEGFFIALGVALLCGVIYALLCCYGSRASKSFAVATALLPMAVAMVIMLVNGNLGIGVAIAGAFGLVRFRSAPGTAKEIAIIFIGMAAGLAFGMGYLAYGAIFIMLCGLLLLAFNVLSSTAKLAAKREKLLKVTIPEGLDYTDVFDDIFAAYTTSAELIKVKSVNMGSMFRLTYKVKLKDIRAEKAMIDDIRVRNGNLEIIISRADINDDEL